MQALDRLVGILEAVAASKRPVGAADVAQATGLSLPTVARLMQELVAQDMLHRSAHDRRYTLGPKLFTLARAAAAQLDGAALVRPVLDDLRDVTGETVSLHVLRGGQRVCVAEAPSRHEVRRVVPLGLTQPLVGTATGEVLLAGATAEERSRVLDSLGLAAPEQRELERRLERVREQGWALVVDDWRAGLAGLSAAVRDGGITVAALSASGPSARFTEKVARGHVDDILEAARQLSEHAGSAVPMEA